MRIHDARDPYQWLMAPPIVIVQPSSVLDAFLAGTVRVMRFTGPHTLYRAAGWGLGKTSTCEQLTAHGGWWLDAQEAMRIAGRLDQFQGLLTSGEIKTLFRGQYRNAIALPVRNNDMSEAFRLELPPGESIEGLVGIASPQPVQSYKDARTHKMAMLAGGGEQVYFKRIEGALNSVNPLWVYPERFW